MTNAQAAYDYVLQVWGVAAAIRLSFQDSSRPLRGGDSMIRLRTQIALAAALPHFRRSPARRKNAALVSAFTETSST